MLDAVGIEGMSGEETDEVEGREKKSLQFLLDGSIPLLRKSSMSWMTGER